MASRRRRTRQLSSTLEGCRFDFGPAGKLRAEFALGTVLVDIRDRWESHREEGALHAHWRWDSVIAAEKFIVWRDGEPVALWSSSKSVPVELSGQKYYHLDWFEVRGDLVGGGIGSAVLTLVCWRAVELNADGVVLYAFNDDELLRFYKSLGAREGVPEPWSSKPDLIGLRFPGAAASRLLEAAKDAEEDEEDEER